MASNQAPEAGNKSPAAKIGAREWSFQDDFHVFGAACSAWEPLEQRDDKMEQVAGRAIWLGLSQEVSGAHVVSMMQWDQNYLEWDLSETKLCRTVHRKTHWSSVESESKRVFSMGSGGTQWIKRRSLSSSWKTMKTSMA